MPSFEVPHTNQQIPNTILILPFPTFIPLNFVISP